VVRSAEEEEGVGAGEDGVVVGDLVGGAGLGVGEGLSVGGGVRCVWIGGGR
jgi:hypothetical protein